MSDITSKIFLFVLSVGLLVFSIRALIRTKRIADAIDSVADARVIKALHLGRGFDGKPQYAITYEVLIDSPFEVLVTPTNTPAEMGTKTTIYYEAQNHDNYYIPTKWNIDPRYKSAIIFVLIGATCTLGSIVSFFR